MKKRHLLHDNEQKKEVDDRITEMEGVARQERGPVVLINSPLYGVFTPFYKMRG